MPIPYHNTHIRKNLFKEMHVFRCVHDVHAEFKSQMSPFHILNEKKCYPHGCVYFKWKCKLLAKKKRCFRNFEHVGRECFNCTYFYEEKIHQYPEFIIQNKNQYFEDYEDFEEWVNQLRRKRIRCEGTVADIRPYITLVPENNNRLKRILRGFLIRFNTGYIDDSVFEDTFFLSISTLSQNKLQFRPGDKVEFEASLKLDKGRFKFIKCGRLFFFERGTGPVINKSQMLVSLETAKVQQGQALKCMNCKHGILADIEYPPAVSGVSNRALVCLAGEKNYRVCSSFAQYETKTTPDICAAMRCHHIL